MKKKQVSVIIFTLISAITVLLAGCTKNEDLKTEAPVTVENAKSQSNSASIRATGLWYKGYC